ncbi:hypothetical protein [Amycolatopsis anabasis]|uniref:hypothetical protein n=1 Tax=Amycolatopsis anabasis TaxID=1840409 RepID=UPI00131E07B2|nr:hypothetical protein [Amycolatopsis anabasis]
MSNAMPSPVDALEREVADHPEDAELRLRLGLALETMAEQARSLTRERVRVITTRRQLEICEYAANRILELDLDDERLTASARALRDQVRAGRSWVWVRRPLALTLAVVIGCLGMLAVVLGALFESIPIVVAAGVLGSAALAAIVLRYRRESWRLVAERALPVVWQPGA